MGNPQRDFLFDAFYDLLQHNSEFIFLKSPSGLLHTSESLSREVNLKGHVCLLDKRGLPSSIHIVPNVHFVEVNV